MLSLLGYSLALYTATADAVVRAGTIPSLCPPRTIDHGIYCGDVEGSRLGGYYRLCRRLYPGTPVVDYRTPAVRTEGACPEQLFCHRVESGGPRIPLWTVDMPRETRPRIDCLPGVPKLRRRRRTRGRSWRGRRPESQGDGAGGPTALDCDAHIQDADQAAGEDLVSMHRAWAFGFAPAPPLPPGANAEADTDRGCR